MEDYITGSYNQNTYPKGTNVLAGAFVKKDVNTTVTDNLTKIIVIGSADIVTDASASDYLGNKNFVRNCVNWLAGKEDQLFVAGVDVTQNYLEISNAQTVKVLIIVFLFVLPVAIIITGIIVWLRRKNR